MQPSNYGVMLDVSEEAGKQLKRVANVSEALNDLFHPGVIRAHRNVFTAHGIRSYRKIYEAVRGRIAEIMSGGDAPQIDFSGHDTEGSELFRAFCMADPNLQHINDEATARWSSIFFQSFPTDIRLGDVFCSVLDTDYPSGWVPNIWHSNGIDGVLEDDGAPRVFLDFDETLLFHGYVPKEGEEPIIMKAIRPGALELIREIKNLGARVGLYTGASAPHVCALLSGEIEEYDLYRFDGDAPVQIGRDILTEMAANMDFVISRMSYARLCPHEAFSTLEDCRGILQPHTKRVPLHHVVNLKAIPGGGSRQYILLDDRAAGVGAACTDLRAGGIEIADMSYVQSPLTQNGDQFASVDAFLESISAMRERFSQSNEELVEAVRRIAGRAL